MFAIAMLVAGLAVAALSWAAIRRSDVEDVPANNKPGNNDANHPSNDLGLSRSINHTCEIVREPNRSKLTEPPQSQDHIQYLDQPHILAMLAHAEAEKKQKAKAKRSSNNILDLFDPAEKSPNRDIDESRRRERDRGMER